MYLNQFLLLAAILFCLGVYGVLARKNAVLVLMSIELMLNAVNVNLVAFDAWLQDALHGGQIFALFVITIAAAEVGVGLAIVLLVFRNRETVHVDELRELAEAGAVTGGTETGGTVTAGAGQAGSRPGTGR